MKSKPTTQEVRKAREAAHKLSADLVAMQKELFDAGLFATARAVNEASNKLGWEVADIATRGEK